MEVHGTAIADFDGESWQRNAERGSRRYDYLTLRKGDHVVLTGVSKAKDGWVYGSVNARCGWFPESYLLKEEDTREAEWDSHSQSSWQSTASAGRDYQSRRDRKEYNPDYKRGIGSRARNYTFHSGGF